MSLTLDPARLSRIQRWADGYTQSERFAGLSVCVQQHGREVLFAQSGVRDLDRGAPFDRDTLVRIYSMTKPITSMILMMLVEKGRLHLDAPLSRFLPAFGEVRALRSDATDITQTEPCATPTLHQLLTHRSGFSYPFNPGIVPKAMEDLDLLFKPTAGTLAEQSDLLATLPLAFAPGARWEYSVGIDVIGRVIEVVTGETLDQVFRTRVLGPLGMVDTGFTVPDSALDRFASLYTPLAGDAMNLNASAEGDTTLRIFDNSTGSPFRRTTCFSGGGGLVGSIDDYMTFAECLRLGGQALISPSTAEFMMSNHLPGDIASLGPASFAEQPMEGMGFGIGGGVVIHPARSRVPSSVGDFSWGGMASTFFWVDRVNDFSVVMFTQLSPSSSYPARAELKALVHGALM
ncbi:beta-lactamase family protein [Tateyamaria omphalii]|uniref:serine hydrolase domain-containing protein n=1 Tax=Tateyamaria omphalii TaxID=299262 RepID=UPI001C99F4CF|nr:serine hydrolase domain-containing protein [Tateyamaria omphalii]MBY5932567.1 beta-lactamase family protein [Tateyamaria omphalii]